MAGDKPRFIIADGTLTLSLTGWEKIGAFHTSPSIGLSEVRAIHYVDEVWRSPFFKGIRAPGTGFPFLIMLGTLRTLHSKALCVVYKKGPGVVIDLASGPFQRWIVSIPHDQARRELREVLLG